MQRSDGEMQAGCVANKLPSILPLLLTGRESLLYFRSSGRGGRGFPFVPAAVASSHPVTAKKVLAVRDFTRFGIHSNFFAPRPSVPSLIFARWPGRPRQPIKSTHKRTLPCL